MNANSIADIIFMIIMLPIWFVIAFLIPFA